MTALLIGVIAVVCMIVAALMLGHVEYDDVMKIADAVREPRGPDDDPEFINSLRGPQ